MIMKKKETISKQVKDRTIFSTGAMRDLQGGKECYTETMSWSGLKRYARYMTKKKEKYGVGNFKKGIPITSYEESLPRHYQKYMENKFEEGQVEADDDHLAGMLFNIFGIMHEEAMAEKRLVKKQLALKEKKRLARNKAARQKRLDVKKK